MTDAPRTATLTKCGVDTSVLLIIDVQTNLGQAMPAKVLNRVVSNTSLLSRAAGLLGVPVMVTQQYPKGLGATLDEVIAALPDSANILDKTTFSATGAAGFNDALRNAGRRQIVIGGMESHVCVLQSAFDLLAENLEVYVVEDAVCSRRLENYQNALDRLRGAGVSVVSAESVLFEWLADSRHEHFKAISAMLR